MSRTLRYLFFLLCIGLGGSAVAQEILGTVVDEKTKEPLTSASIQVKQGGILKGGAVADIDGNYSVKPLDPGTYDVTVSFTGYATQTIQGVLVSNDKKTGLNIKLGRSDSKVLDEVKIIRYKRPLIDKYENGKTVLDAAQIKTRPTTQTADLVAYTPGVYQARRGGGFNSDGGRSTGNLVIIDGVQVQGTTGIDMAQGSVDQIEVISSGLPANYGDVSGAVVNITSRGIAEKFSGSARLQHSIDGYNNNLASFSVGGPLLKRKPKDSTRPKEAVMGFALSGDYYNDNNRYPAYYKEYVTKSSVLQDLRQNPFRITTDNSGQKIYNYASQYITEDQLTRVKQPPHRKIVEYRLNGKIDAKINNNTKIVAGGNANYLRQDDFNRARNLFAPEATPQSITSTARGFLRFQQSFGKPGYLDTGKKSIISNAHYSVQVDFQRLYTSYEDPKFGRDIFKYQYVGRFDTKYQDIYIPGAKDDSTGKFGTVLFLKTPVRTDFYRSELNPILANYTSQYYNSVNRENASEYPRTVQQVQSTNALANGDLPNFTYGLYNTTGSTLSGYSKYSSNQYAFTADANFDLKAGPITHGIKFGLYYQQRIIRAFSASSNNQGAGTSSLWRLMRQSVSSWDNGKLALDKSNPIFRYQGKDYTWDAVVKRYKDENGQYANVNPGPTDTIYYNYTNKSQTAFDKNLRARLGKGLTDNISIDNLSMDEINKLSLNLFSADELLNLGNPYVSYYGFNYDGSAQTGTVNFNDFWTARDKNGNYTRPIPAFTPNYVAGYILDQFQYKDLQCNIGIRVERYSANNKVLKDPYSLYGTRKIKDASGASNLANGGKHPSNLSENAVIYVADNPTGVNPAAPNIIGYREGDTWYDALGNATNDPRTLNSGSDPQPYIVDPANKITDSGYNANNAFTDYNPQVTVMPRLQINFPITDKSKFLAHYDILVQRPYPTDIGNANAYTYYYLQTNAGDIQPNANLRSQKTFDYELGFEQQIGNNSVLKLNAFYKERKDLISIRPYLYAWPTTYYTYGNRDFSSTKGLKTYYEMRATRNLSMSVSYTLQFAEGTGSDANSANGGSGGQVSTSGLLQAFIQAGQPNLRFLQYLNIDSRHNIVANLDYRYGNNEGPVIKGLHIFQNAGLNFVARARSGEPFTRLANPFPGNRTIIGGINGSRLPWHFSTDLRINKDFAFEIGKRNKDLPQNIKQRKEYRISAYMFINNLLNTREVMGVYGYTGKVDDNGYLTSPVGLQNIPVQVNPQSYVDLYRIGTLGWGNLNYARTINLGVEFTF